MSIKSMTGFGRGEEQFLGKTWIAELRCVNNRYFDFKARLPKNCTMFEEPLRKLLAKRLQRGRVDLAVSLSGENSELKMVKVNLELARSYRLALSEISSALNLEDQISVAQLASLPDIFIREQEDEGPDAVWRQLEAVVAEALARCEEMRLQEGQLLKDDLQARLGQFAATVDTIENAIPDLLRQRQRTLEERLEKLLGQIQLDPARLAQEVAILADKTDVTEEIVRLRCHIKQFLAFLEGTEAVGRKLDFLVQEFLREVNTLASKINDAGIAHLTVDLKAELEKMREQIQNIE
jgi:uncharacterized protein (TIGR00255 family)